MAAGDHITDSIKRLSDDGTVSPWPRNSMAEILSGRDDFNVFGSHAGPHAGAEVRILSKRVNDM